MHKNIAIKIDNLTKIYNLYKTPQDRLKEALNPFKKSYHKEFYALNDVSFEIKKGEVIGIIGRNGSGKSTLLKIITGVLTQSSGSVHVNGKISAILELGAGFNPQLSGLENIYLSMSINGYSKREADSKVQTIIDFAELNEFIHQPTKTYSSGMNARLGFAVAINIEPDILIVDEALSVGDAAFQRKCFAKMEEIRQSGATILFVSHSDGSIVSLCGRAIWISSGKKIIEGEPKFVTGLYMKHSNQKHINKAIIEEEFNELKLKVKNSDKKEIKQEIEKVLEEFYDPSLKPKSTIYYEEKGAKISDVKVTNLNNTKVNVLAQKNEYILKYNISFVKKKNNVILGMSLYTKTGIVIASGNYPKNDTYSVLDSENMTIEWKFKCSVLDGDYFFTVGVMDEKHKFMARIKDVYMIKVINNANSQLRGIVDINLKGSLLTC